jgi:tripeptide aminopeptidase
MDDTKSLTKTFCDLVKIPSPSGKESAVAEYVKRYLGRMGAEVNTDGAGRLIGGDQGNLIARIGRGEPRVMFVAHLDTVEDGRRRVRPVIRDGVARSDGKTILGADNKAAVACLLEAMKKSSRDPRKTPLLAAFTVGEEGGTMGANYLSIPKGVRFVFDLDGGDGNPSGTFVNGALGRAEFSIRITGKEAHAAASPEKGRNAIKAAGLIIARLRVGKRADGSTLNIGRISGGGLMNVVPGNALIEGETRDFDLKGIERSLKEIRGVAEKVCGATGCRCLFSTNLKSGSFDPPFSVAPQSRIADLARKSDRGAGLRFSLVKCSGTLQANHLALKGREVLGLISGSKLAHSKSEYVRLSEMANTKKLILEIIRNVGGSESGE